MIVVTVAFCILKQNLLATNDLTRTALKFSQFPVRNTFFYIRNYMKFDGPNISVQKIVFWRYNTPFYNGSN